MKDLIPFVGNRKARERLDEVFSRHMLGSVALSGAAGKVVEKVIELHTASTMSELLGWLVAFTVFLHVFVYWDAIEAKKDDAVDAAGDAIGDATDKASDAVDNVTDRDD